MLDLHIEKSNTVISHPLKEYPLGPVAKQQVCQQPLACPVVAIRNAPPCEEDMPDSTPEVGTPTVVPEERSERTRSLALLKGDPIYTG